MNLINVIGGFLVDLLIYPMKGMDPSWSLGLLSVLTGLFFLFVFKWTSNQEGIFQAKQRLKAHLLELRLYASDMVLSMRAQKDLFLANLNYMRQMLRPVIILLVPVVLLLVQLDMRYGLRPLAVGETTVLRVRLSPTTAAGTEPVLELPAGIETDSPALRIPSEREVNWRLRAVAPGDHVVRISVGRDQVGKRVRVEGPLAVLTPEVRQPSLLSTLARPGEPPLPAGGPIQSIAFDYPEREVSLFGFRMHWLIFFFIVSIVPAYALKGLFGVEV